MASLIILTVLLLALGGYSAYRSKQQEKQDYADYMAKRISFDVNKEFNKEE